MWARKAMPDGLQPAFSVFEAQAERVEQARRALLSCLPLGRVDPAPVPVGLHLLRDEVCAVVPELGRWRVTEVEAVWQRVHTGCDESLAHVERAEKVATTTDELEELLDAVAAVVEPLDVWRDAELVWRGLRERVGRRARQPLRGPWGGSGEG